METLNEHMHIPEPTAPNQKNYGTRIFMCVVSVVVIAVAMFFIFSRTPTDAVKAQLQALRNDNFAAAYSLTSSDFQQGTSADRFKEFIEKYPILLHNNDIIFNESKSEGTIGYVSGKLEDKEGNTATIEYQLAKENGHWAIQALRLSDFNSAAKLTAESDKSGAKIASILVSNHADHKGFVTQDEKTLSTTAPKIFATVNFSVPHQDVKISAILINTKNGGRIGPSTDKVEKKGDVMKAFSFTHEKNNWPQGMYEITISLSTGATKTVKFEVK